MSISCKATTASQAAAAGERGAPGRGRAPDGHAVAPQPAKRNCWARRAAGHKSNGRAAAHGPMPASGGAARGARAARIGSSARAARVAGGEVGPAGAAGGEAGTTAVPGGEVRPAGAAGGEAATTEMAGREAGPTGPAGREAGTTGPADREGAGPVPSGSGWEGRRRVGGAGRAAGAGRAVVPRPGPGAGRPMGAGGAAPSGAASPGARRSSGGTRGRSVWCAHSGPVRTLPSLHAVEIGRCTAPAPRLPRRSRGSAAGVHSPCPSRAPGNGTRSFLTIAWA